MTVGILIVWRRFGIREGDYQPQRDVPVAEHETGRVQARHDLAAERSADKDRHRGPRSSFGPVVRHPPIERSDLGEGESR
jgi:hypothetical protein